MRTISLITLALLSLHALAQNKTSFGTDNATRCYQESNAPLSTHGLSFCTKAIRHDDLLLGDLAATHTNRGIIFSANGELKKAMKDHRKALLIAPKMGKIYINRGNVFHQERKYDLALKDYEKAIELGNVPLDIAHYNRSLALIKLKHWENAILALETSIEINPESKRVRRKLEELKQSKNLKKAD